MSLSLSTANSRSLAIACVSFECRRPTAAAQQVERRCFLHRNKPPHVYLYYTAAERAKESSRKKNKTAAAIVYCYWTSNCTTAVFELSSLICEQLIEVLCVFFTQWKVNERSMQSSSSSMQSRCDKNYAIIACVWRMAIPWTSIMTIVCVELDTSLSSPSSLRCIDLRWIRLLHADRGSFAYAWISSHSPERPDSLHLSSASDLLCISLHFFFLREVERSKPTKIFECIVCESNEFLRTMNFHDEVEFELCVQFILFYFI